MAKHEVKCPICNETFDTNKEQFQQIGRRYLHQSCFDACGGIIPTKAKEKLKKAAPAPEDSDLTNLKNYINIIYPNPNWAMIMKQIKKFKDENNYSYRGMQTTLYYFYEIKKNPIDKSNNAIGIIPFVYNEAFDYFNNIQQAQTKVDVDLEDRVIEVVIKPPKKKGLIKRMFNLGDE